MAQSKRQYQRHRESILTDSLQPINDSLTAFDLLE